MCGLFLPLACLKTTLPEGLGQIMPRNIKVFSLIGVKTKLEGQETIL